MNTAQARAVNRNEDAVDLPLAKLVATREQSRLYALNHYDVMDSPPEEAFESITRLTRQLFGVPMAAISFIDAHREWFKSRDGVGDAQIARHTAFSATILAEDAPLIVYDAVEDERFRDNTSVAGAPYIRFYAGSPLRDSAGQIIGVLAAMDSAPRDFGRQEMKLLSDLGEMVMTVLELRRRTTVDPVTGVMSRGAFWAEAERSFLLARRHRQELSCLMIGIDHLEPITERHGTKVGDEIQRSCAEALQRSLRASDIVGRLGKATFTVLLPFTGKDGARDAAARLHKAVAEAGMTIGGTKTSLAASLGHASVDEEMKAVSDLIEEAEAGLFHARQYGGDRIVAWPRNALPAAHMRRRVILAGHLEWGAQDKPTVGTVRALSDRYALIEVMSGAAVPDIFDLRLPTEIRSRHCRVLSREPRQVEVEIS